MLKGRGNGGDVLKSNTGNCSSSTMVGTSDTALLEPTEKAKKKFSFRAPEIIGYYMQMKQGVANRLSKRIKSPRNGSKVAAAAAATNSPSAKGCIFKNCASEDNEMNAFGGSTEDLNLEV